MYYINPKHACHSREVGKGRCFSLKEFSVSENASVALKNKSYLSDFILKKVLNKHLKHRNE